MQGIGEPELIYSGQQSPHIQSIKPSMVRLLSISDLVVMTGKTFEQSVAKYLTEESGIEYISLLNVLPEQSKLGPRERLDHDRSNDDHSDFQFDPHVWLSPAVSIDILDVVAARLQQMDPSNALTYEKNTDRAKAAINQLDHVFKRELESVKNSPFLVFHDAFQYFEQAYGLQLVGSVLIGPENLPGARRVSELRSEIRKKGVRCVFSEPQFDSRKLEALVEGLNIRIAVLDPLGSEIAPGPDLWFEMMANLVSAFKQCLR